ncbi:hypothetical protein ABIC30_006178 [Methylobacterium sp. 1030]
MKAARLSWFERQLDLDPDRLVFLDETATNTKMARRYGRAPRGERCRVAVPFGHWKTTTVTAGLRTSGLMATALFDGPMTGARFRDYVEQTLVPALRPGDTVVLDNLPAHKVSGLRECIEAAGARLLYLPAIPPTSTRSNSPSPRRPFFVPRLLARSATYGILSNEPSDASRQPNAAAISSPQATTHMIQRDRMPL